MLPKKYNTQEAEKKWHQIWESSNTFKWDQNESKENSFVIDTPPPTVSGLLHMGHIFSYTQTDFIARFMRMKGKNVFYPIGFDDNGLPTERLVEKEKGIKASEMSRQDFIDECKSIVEEAEVEFRKLFKSVGLSFDWDQEYQTISPTTTQLSQLSFLDLYEKKALERHDAPSFWDPVDRTAIAQAEIEDKEKDGMMVYINFSDEEGNPLSIATTRPEMIPACQAVFFHPDDKRFAHLKGKEAVTPIFNKKVPLLADDEVDMEKGTGLVMCCTFGDIQDITWWRKHDLGITQVITLEGKMQNAGDYNDLYVKKARAQIIEDLDNLGVITKKDPTKQFVKCAERSGAPLEIIPTPQWYIKVLDKKEEFLKKNEECDWYPDYMKIRLDNWINGLNQDWCISRQRFFGVPFPVWYSKREGEEGKIIVATQDQLPIDPQVGLPKGYTREEVEAETDVMDTWATSSITPMINSHGINENYAIDIERHKKLYPADLRPQAHEIIRTWTFSTIVKSYYHENSIPWKNLAISGWVLAADKTKMSKSKGNVVTPTDLIIDRGADTVRYWASNSKLGVDTAYSEELFKIGNKLINKLWNASKFCGMFFEKFSDNPQNIEPDYSMITEDNDKWILSALHNTIKDYEKAFDKFEYADARVSAENFFWNDLCDNYLELVKGRLYDEAPENEGARRSGVFTLNIVLKNVLKLFTPFIPHLCEEINEHLYGNDEFLSARGSWPKASSIPHSEASIKLGEEVKEVVRAVRTHKSEAKIALNAEWTDEVEYNSSIITDSALADLKRCLNARNFKGLDKTQQSA